MTLLAPAPAPTAPDHLEIYPRPRPFKVPTKLKVIVGVMVVCALLGLVGFVASSRKHAVTSGPRYEGFAALVAQNYLDGHPLNVARAQGLTTSLGRQLVITAKQSGTKVAVTTTPAPFGVVAVAFDRATDVFSKSGTIETDYFWVEYKDGSVGELAVVVHGTPSGPVLGAPPSLLPIMHARTTQTVVASGVAHSGTAIPPGFVKQIDAWASAYAAGNGTALYTLTGDTAKAVYRGLGGYRVEGEPVIVSSTPWTARRPPKTVVVTIDVMFQSVKNPKVVAESSFDLLLDNLTNAYPSIAAWGPPGSGPNLVPFQNAGSGS